MRVTRSSLLIVLLFFTYASCQAAQVKPTIQEVEPALKIYLTAVKVKNCTGDVTVDQLSIISVGDYDQELGGWPVYANFKVVCHSEAGNYTWVGTEDSERVMAAVAHKTNFGKLECFVPEKFKQYEQEFSSGMNKALEEMNVRIENSLEESDKKKELHKKEAQTKEKVKEGFVKGLVHSSYGGGTLGNVDIAGLTIWVEDKTVFEGIESFDKLKMNDCAVVTYYMFNYNAIAKHIRVLKSPDEFSEAFYKEYASAPFALTPERIKEAITYYKELGQDQEVNSLAARDINVFDLGLDAGYVQFSTPFVRIAKKAATLRNKGSELSYDDAEKKMYEATGIIVALMSNQEEEKMLSIDAVKCLVKTENEIIDLSGNSSRYFSCDSAAPYRCKVNFNYEFPTNKVAHLSTCTLIIKHPLRGDLAVEIDLNKIK